MTSDPSPFTDPIVSECGLSLIFPRWYNDAIMGVKEKLAFGSKLSGLHGIRITGVRITGIRITGIRITGIRITGVRITRIRITGVRITGIRITGVRITGIRITGVRNGGVLIIDQLLYCEIPTVFCNGILSSVTGQAMYRMYSVTLGCFRATIITVEKRVLRILRVCL